MSDTSQCVVCRRKLVWTNLDGWVHAGSMDPAQPCHRHGYEEKPEPNTFLEED